MPLLTKIVPAAPAADQTLSDQDKIDLNKILIELPQYSGSSPEQLSSAVSDLCQRYDLVSGYFNERILAACWLKQTDSHTEVKNLCVRSVTRRRGVGKKLLIDLQQLLSADNKPFSCDERDSELAQAFKQSLQQ